MLIFKLDRVENVIQEELKPKTYTGIIKVTLNEFKSLNPEELHSRAQTELGR